VCTNDAVNKVLLLGVVNQLIFSMVLCGFQNTNAHSRVYGPECVTWLKFVARRHANLDLDLDSAHNRNCIRVTGTGNKELDIDMQQLKEESHEHDYVLR
jgi:hypothetical protein